MLCCPLVSFAIAAEQSSEQSSILRADHHLEFAGNPVKVENEFRLTILLFLGFCFFLVIILLRVVDVVLAGRRQASSPLDRLRCVIVQRARATAGMGPQRA